MAFLAQCFDGVFTSASLSGHVEAKFGKNCQVRLMFLSLLDKTDIGEVRGVKGKLTMLQTTKSHYVFFSLLKTNKRKKG
jgi:hypothetical protein